jgi:hypothetical protein
MQQRPNTGIGETFVKAGGFFLTEKDRNTAIFLGEPSCNLLLPFWFRKGSTWPSDPLGCELIFRESFQSGNETPGRPVNLIVFDSDGQTIGNINQSVGHG